MKWKCKTCGWCGDSKKVLTAQHPFDWTDTVMGCPVCLSVGDFWLACQYPRCKERVEMGVNTAKGYKNLCTEHGRKLQQEAK